MLNEKYLKPMLDAGSSRVFNCNNRATKLLKEHAQNPYFFKVPNMHGLVLIKEVTLDQSHEGQSESIVGTKVYLPYNQDDVYEGGRSVFVHDSQLFEILNAVFGLSGASMVKADLEHDMRILQVLDRLPSLDGFLMRDALEIEGVVPNDEYFEVSDEERAAIHEFIRRKFEPLVRAAHGGGSSLTHQVDDLIDKMWEAKDVDALAPLIRAFQLPSDRALAIFSSWKGINFYAYEYHRTKERREQFAVWLRDKATPRNHIAKAERGRLEQLRRVIVRRFRGHWNSVHDITSEYESLYDRFLTDGNGAGDFVAFLHRSHEIYWQMGMCLSTINHAIFCWDAVSGSYADRRLTDEKLGYLFHILQSILIATKQVRTTISERAPVAAPFGASPRGSIPLE